MDVEDMMVLMRSKSLNLRPIRRIAFRATRSWRVTNSTSGRPKLSLDRASIPDRLDQCSETRTPSFPISQFADPGILEFRGGGSDFRPG